MTYKDRLTSNNERQKQMIQRNLLHIPFNVQLHCILSPFISKYSNQNQSRHIYLYHIIPKMLKITNTQNHCVPQKSHLPLQGMPQFCHCTMSPTQNLPPLAGFGWSHARKRLLCPSPQVRLQAPHEDHVFHLPSTTESANMNNDGH